MLVFRMTKYLKGNKI